MLKGADHGGGSESPQHVEAEPRHSSCRRFPERAERPFFDADSGHLVHVLCGLVSDNVDNVVHGDHAHEAAVVIHNRERQEVVFGDQSGRFFLIDGNLSADRIGDHDFV